MRRVGRTVRIYNSKVSDFHLVQRLKLSFGERKCPYPILRRVVKVPLRWIIDKRPISPNKVKRDGAVTGSSRGFKHLFCVDTCILD